MAKNTHYAVIDHMGSLTSQEITEVYAIANKMVKDAGFEKVFRIKELVKRCYPRARNVDGAKWVARHNKHPELVLFICPLDLTAKIKSGISAWEKEGTKVILVQPRKYRLYEPTAKEASMFYDYGDTDSKRRMIASIWAPALGYNFEHPLYRDRQDEIPDEYMHLSSKFVEAVDHGSIDKDDLSTYSTRGDKFLSNKRAIVSEAELDEFWNFYIAVRQSPMPIEEFLDPDYKICPICGRPYRQGAGSSVECPRCGYEEEDTELVSYFDDNEDLMFSDTSKPQYDAFDIGCDVDTEKYFCGIPVEKATPDNHTGSTVFTATNYDETWRWYSTWEDFITR